MREFWEFRVSEEHAHLLFADDEGKRLGTSVRKIIIAVDDPRFPEVRRLQAEFRTRGETFFTGYSQEYRYTKEEIEKAELFDVWITAAFEPTGEECGTVYDESETCEECGAGRRQVSDLVLDLRKVPKSKQFARTIADECIVSQRLAELMVDAKLTGFDLAPVRHKARYQDDLVDFKSVPSGRKLLEQAKSLRLQVDEWEFDVWLNRPEQKELLDKMPAEHAELLAGKARKNWKPPPVWYQLIVTSNPVPIVPPTRTGGGAFDDDPENKYRCPFGHVVGLNIFSEVFVARDCWDGSDIVCTSNLVGHRMGLLVPSPCLLISPRFRRLLRENKIRGYKTDVAYMV